MRLFRRTASPVVRTIAVVATATLALSLGTLSPATAAPAVVRDRVPAPEHQLTKLRDIIPSEFGLDHPEGVDWSDADGLLVVAGDDGDGTEAVTLTPDGELHHELDLPTGSDAATLATDEAGNAIVVDGADVVETTVDAAPRTRQRGAAAGVADPSESTVDPDSGELTLLDSRTGHLVTTDKNGDVSRQLPAGLHPQAVEAVAHNSEDDLLYVADTRGDRLVGYDDDLEPVVSYGMGELEVTDLQSMAFGPSTDPTDDPSRESLFLVDSGEAGTNGIVLEVTLAAVENSAPTATGQLLRSIDLTQLDPASPDSSGIVYLPGRDHFVISDSEVNEMPLYEGVNLWETTRQPVTQATGTTVPSSNEPTGVGYHPDTGHLFTSNDDLKRVFEHAPGPDGEFGTADDTETSFSTAAVGNTDPEGIEIDAATGDIYLVDGVGRGVTRVSPGDNGVFDGVPPLGDDTFSNFDLEILGAVDPEGMGYDPVRDTLLVLDDTSARIYELARNGSLINAIDISAIDTQKAAGVTVAPRWNDTGQRSYYIVDRGLDNNSHPDENDGRMFEIAADLPPVTNLPPAADAGPDIDMEVHETATLNGSVSDDGEPNGTLAVEWSVMDGPGSVIFGDPSQAGTTATFSTPGTYTLRLGVDDGSHSDVDDVRVTVVETGGVHYTEFPVQLGTDDAEEAATGFVSVTSADLELVDDGTTNQTVGMRFADVGLPAGSIVEEAHVQFQADEISDGPASLRLHGEAVDDAATYQAVRESISTRPRTITSVPWEPAPWPAIFERGPAQRSADIAQVVQEIVDRPGWSAGNALAVMVTGEGRRTAEARDGTAAPVLQVGWRRPVAGTNRAPILSAGADQQIQLPADATLTGVIEDDGLPNPPAQVTSTWTQESGPGTVSFAQAGAAETTASFSEAGTYVLRLTADDGELQSFDEITVTVLAADAPRSVSIPIAAGADDAEQVVTGFMSTTNNDLELGYDGAHQQIVGLRYNLPVPAGAVIDSATVQFTVDEVSTDPTSLQIQAEASDDAAPFEAVSRNLTARDRGSVGESWSPAPWPTINVSGEDQTTPDIASVLQAVVDRPGWQAGNHAALLVSGDGRRTAESFEGGPPPVLHLTWHVPEEGANRAPLVDAGLDREIQLPATANLSGSVDDDGLPDPPGAVSTTWTKVTGPGVVTFADASAPETTASFSTAGEYLLRLTADDGEHQVSDEVVVTALPVDAEQSASIPIAVGADDAEQVVTGFMSTTNNDLELGYDGTHAQVVGLRYALPIEPGAIIESATVRFTADEVSTDPTNLLIQAEAAADAAPFEAVSGNLTARARTTASVAWVPEPWSAANVSGEDHTTPDFANVVQEVVDRPGWQAGSHAAVLVSGDGRRTAESFEGGPPPVLDVTWRMPAPPENQAPVVAAGANQQIVLPATASLTGSVTDDGLPDPPASVSSTWTTVSGPGTVTFDDPGAAETTATFSEAGTYVLRLTGDDGEKQSSADLTATVDPEPRVALERDTDYDGDGNVDVIARDGDVLWLYPGDGDGGLGARVPMATGWNGMNAVLGAGDMDADGSADVVGRDGNGRLWLYPGDGSGALGTRTQIATGWGSLTGFGAGDFDGDGNLDLLGRTGNNQLWLYPGDGNGGLQARVQLATGFNQVVAVTGAGDVDGDGWNDVVMRDNGGGVWLYPGTGTGLAPRVQMAAGWNSIDAIFGGGDMNGDGHRDLIARETNGSLWLYPGSSSGGLGPRTQIGNGFGAMTLIS